MTAAVDTPQEYLELYRWALDTLAVDLGRAATRAERVKRDALARRMVEAYYRGRLDRQRIEAAR